MLDKDTSISAPFLFDWSPSSESQECEELEQGLTGQDSLHRFFDELFQESQFVDGSPIPTDSTAIDPLVDASTSARYQHLSTKLLSALRNEEFEFGMVSYSENIIEEELAVNALETRNWLNELFVSNFSDAKVLTGLLHVISRFRELEMHPQGITMALAALSHKDNEVKELGVRAFEHWGSLHSLKVLKEVKVGTLWLQKYIDEVVEDLSLEHGISCSQIHAE